MTWDLKQELHVAEHWNLITNKLQFAITGSIYKNISYV